MNITQSPPRPKPGAPASAHVPAAPALPPERALALPCAFVLALLALAALPPVRRHPDLLPTFLGAAGLLLAWCGALVLAARRAGRRLTLEVALHRHHWVQACAQVTVLLYWGWHARFVYAFLPLIVAQLVFAYAVDGLLTWSRRDRYALGFGPFPIILSINLFLWFRPEWFHWQFVMIAVGYLGKELIRWNRDGRSTHVFNPSSFPLALFSLALILAGASDATLGSRIASTQPDAPHIYLLIFLVALPGQILFGVARMTMPAVVTMYAISLAYLGSTGTYLFFDSHIPLPVFLGMHLLVTDPSTAPRTGSGRVAFGVLYALATLVFYLLLGWAGLPTFYDKLLPVPLLNLLVRRIDRVAASGPLAGLHRPWPGLTARHANLAIVGLWSGIFLGMSMTQGVGDRHPGQYLPFWQQACATGSVRACDYAVFTEFVYCGNGSGWACNEWGIEMTQRSSRRQAAAAFGRACDLGFPPGCENARALAAGGGRWARARPRLEDLPILLRGTRKPLQERAPARLYALACEQGWPGACAWGREPGRP